MEVPQFKTLEFSPKKHDYCVGIPLLNEGDKILKQLERMFQFGIHHHTDIIIFDGGSTDGSTSSENLTKYAVRTLLIKEGPGKQGAQFRMGFSYLLSQGYKGVVTIDGNNKDSIESIPTFIEKLKEGHDFIQGSRFIEGGEHINTPLSRLFAVKFIHSPWISFLARFRYTDTTSGYRGISRELVEDKNLNIFRNIFSAYELLFYMSVMAPKLGKKVCEIPVTRAYPLGKTPTKISFWGNFKIIFTLIKLTFGHYN
jgi:dolichol-phosphate mannosyltransferase